MKRMLAAAALAAALATPAFAQQPQNPPTQSLSSTPAANPPTHSATEGAMRPGMMGGAMGPGMMERQMMMRHHKMAWRNPKEACIDRLARRAGVLAYIGAKLNLNAQQQPLWDKVQSTASDTARQERQLCATIKPPSEETALDRLTHREQVEAARLAGLKTAIPEVRQLYQALTPQQRAILDHPFRG